MPRCTDVRCKVTSLPLFGLFYCALCESQLHAVCGCRVQQEHGYQSVCYDCESSVQFQNDALRSRGLAEVSLLDMVQMRNAQRAEEALLSRGAGGVTPEAAQAATASAKVTAGGVTQEAAQAATASAKVTAGGVTQEAAQAATASAKVTAGGVTLEAAQAATALAKATAGCSGDGGLEVVGNDLGRNVGATSNSTEAAQGNAVGNDIGRNAASFSSSDEATGVDSAPSSVDGNPIEEEVSSDHDDLVRKDATGVDSAPSSVDGNPIEEEVSSDHDDLVRKDTEDVSSDHDDLVRKDNAA
jgi:hypothetical protein